MTPRIRIPPKIWITTLTFSRGWSSGYNNAKRRRSFGLGGLWSEFKLKFKSSWKMFISSIKMLFHGKVIRKLRSHTHCWIIKSSLYLPSATCIFSLEKQENWIYYLQYQMAEYYVVFYVFSYYSFPNTWKIQLSWKKYNPV